MASFTFDRQIKLSEKGLENLLDILSQPAEPINVKPLDEKYWKEVDELLKKHLLKDKKSKTE